jgi:hypothetical protein
METARIKPNKPLGRKAYGSIPHLPGSRRGPADKGLSEHQAAICTSKARDKHDLIYVHEKLDGSNCSVAKVEGCIVALGRSGYLAETSPYVQHHYFAQWVASNNKRFSDLLEEGERCCGEWLAQAHGTRYKLTHEPYVIFDLIKGDVREPFANVEARAAGFVIPRMLHAGPPVSVEAICSYLEPSGHGAIDPVEGAVWRVERRGGVDFLGKYVRPEKVDGCFLPENNGGETIWNWQP